MTATPAVLGYAVAAMSTRSGPSGRGASGFTRMTAFGVWARPAIFQWQPWRQTVVANDRSISDRKGSVAQ